MKIYVERAVITYDSGAKTAVHIEEDCKTFLESSLAMVPARTLNTLAIKKHQ